MRRIGTATALIGALLLGAPAQAGADDPKTVIATMVNGIIDVLEHRADKTRLTDADREAIRRLVYPRMDFRLMARRALGKTWRTLDADEQARFTRLFRDLIEYTYGNRLAEYKGQKVRFSAAEYNKRGDKARVKTAVIEPDKEIPVEYRLRRTKDGWRIYDVRIEGASLVRTFRQDFQSLLDQGGYAHLVKRLEEKVAKLKQPS